MTPHSTPVEAIRIRPARQEDVSLMARWAEAMALETEDKPLDPDTVARGIQLAFAELKGPVKDRLRGYGMGALIAPAALRRRRARAARPARRRRRGR